MRRGPSVADRFRLALANPRFRIVMLVWAMLLVAVLSFPYPQGFGIDPLIYLAALKAIQAGQPAYLVLDPVATALSEGRPILFFPPPISAVVGGYLASVAGGALPTLIAGIAVMSAAFALVRRVTPPIPSITWPTGRRTRLLLALVAWFAFLPSIHALWFGNQQTLVLLGIALLAVGLIEERPWMAGLGLAVATLFKLGPLLFGAPLAVAGRWRELAWALGLVALGVAATIPVVGAGPWLDFVRSLLQGTGQVATQGYNISPLGGAFPYVSPLAWVAITGLAMALTGRLEPRRMLAASIAVFLFGWPVAWPHYAVIALVAMALLLSDDRTHVALGVVFVLLSAPWREAWAIALVLLLIAAVRPSWLVLWSRPARSPADAPTQAAPPAPATPPGPAAPG